MADAVSDRTLSDLITGKQRASVPVGLARAALGQGLGMGWGDEAEAWLRSKLGQGGYEGLVRRIREEQGTFAKEYPFTSGAAELAGGVAPGVAMMMVPGGQAAGAAQLGRSTAGTLARMGALGAATGAVSGAGSAEEGSRIGGATAGGILGGGIGVATPTVIRAGSAGARWLRDKLAPTPGRITERAAGKLQQAVEDAGLKPRDLPAAIARDRELGVPSVLANVDPALADLARGVAQRAGRGARKVEEKLIEQGQGSRERVYQKTKSSLGGGNYYDDEERMVKDLRERARNVYDEAYAQGDVDDPRIAEVLQNPQFQAFFTKARGIADMEAQAAKLRGEDPKKFALPEIYKPSGVMDESGNEVLQLVRLPDVRTLDYIKRGIDAVIDRGFDGNALSKTEASALRDLRREFVNAIDQNVPAYKAARQVYAGDMEVLDAMRTGFNDFNRLDHEEVIKMVAAMTPSEKEAFRTGVVRNLYGQIMKPSVNINAAQRLVGSPEMVAKLQPLFESPAQFKLFRAGLEREAQLVSQAQRVLGGSSTAKNLYIQGMLDSDQGVGEAVAAGVTGGFSGSMLSLLTNFIRSGKVKDETADRLADMLMSSDPTEVASVVRLLEQNAAQQAPKALRAGRVEAGATTGLTTSMWPQPAPGEGPDIEEGEDIDAMIQRLSPGAPGIEDEQPAPRQ